MRCCVNISGMARHAENINQINDRVPKHLSELSKLSMTVDRGSQFLRQVPNRPRLGAGR
jgi:hypothetical protein